MNKAEEWKLLNAAFLPGEIEGAIEAESPDFLVPRGEEFFGVEITEAFMSESQARMRMIPGYVGEVLNHRRYRHRRDKRIYPIRRVQYKAQDGSQVDLEAMVHMNPTPEERASRLGAAIIAKAARVSSYRSQCSTVELVLRDRGIFSDTVEKSDLGTLFRSKTLRTIIQQSGFREVRYLVQAKDGGHFCYPIRMGFLAEGILLFFGALAEAQIIASPVDAGSALSSHLAQTGFQSISVFATEDGRLVVFCEVAVAVYDREQQYIAIHDYHSKEAKRLKDTVAEPCSGSGPLLSFIAPILAGAACHFDFARPTSIEDK